MARIEKDTKKRISDLLYVEKEFISIIHSEIDEIMRGRGRTKSEIRKSIEYMLEDRFTYIEDDWEGRKGYECNDGYWWQEIKRAFGKRRNKISRTW